MRALPNRPLRWLLTLGAMLAIMLIPSAIHAEDPPPRTGDVSDGINAAAATAAQTITALNLPAGSAVNFGTSDANGYAAHTTVASGFPVQGTSYMVLSTGIAAAGIFGPQGSFVSTALSGLNNSAGEDLVQMRLTIPIPVGATCWGISWKFLSEEYPEWVGSAYNDSILIEVGASTFTISGATVSAPNNVAFGPPGTTPITVNTSGALGVTAGGGAGTVYDGGTTVLTTTAPVPAGSILNLIFSVMDLGDSDYDTAVFLDNFHFGTGGGCTGPVTVPNSAPQVAANAPSVTVPEGTTATNTGTWSDPDAGDTVTLSASVGSVVKAGTNAGGTWSWSFPTADGPAQSQTVTITANDGDGGVTTTTFQLIVLNVPPAIATFTASNVNENGSTTLSGTFVDPGTLDTHTVSINWGDSSANTVLNLAAGVLTFSAPHTYLDDNPTATAVDSYTIIIKVADKDSAADTETTSVTVKNLAPVITSVTGPVTPVPVSTATTVTAQYTDVGTLDTHTCTFSWDDLTADTTVSGSAGACSANHTYTAAGVYTVTVTVKDDDTGTATSKFEYVVAYDPSAGFVTGGGWITSPAGAFVADTTLSGKANFGFVAKYHKGAATPSGSTEFQFHAGSFNFHSSDYQWLVIAGAKAQFKGTGTVNGVSGYSFMLTATDGAQPGGGGVDKFRIKVWKTDTGTVVYDNKIGSPDDIDTASPQAIDGGSIVIHNK